MKNEHETRIELHDEHLSITSPGVDIKIELPRVCLISVQDEADAQADESQDGITASRLLHLDPDLKDLSRVKIGFDDATITLVASIAAAQPLRDHISATMERLSAQSTAIGRSA